jgi:hypothetical protein
MKRSFVFALLVLTSCVPALAGSVKAEYKVKVSGGTTKAAVGNSLALTIKPDSIIAIDKSCAVDLVINNSNGNLDCPLEAENFVDAQFPPSAITEVVAGQSAHFVSITWVADGQKATLIFEADKKDYPFIVGLLEEVSGKKAIDADTQTTDRPRVFLRSQSFGNKWGAVRDQSMEMAEDFRKVCPSVLITINQQKADFTVGLNHIEAGLSRDNQVEVYNKDGDLISGKEGGSIMGGVKGACALITKEWTKQKQ